MCVCHGWGVCVGGRVPGDWGGAAGGSLRATRDQTVHQSDKQTKAPSSISDSSIINVSNKWLYCLSIRHSNVESVDDDTVWFPAPPRPAPPRHHHHHHHHHRGHHHRWGSGGDSVGRGSVGLTSARPCWWPPPGRPAPPHPALRGRAGRGGAARPCPCSLAQRRRGGAAAARAGRPPRRHKDSTITAPCLTATLPTVCNLLLNKQCMFFFHTH